MSSFNEQQIIGNLGGDPDVKQGKTGSYCFVSVATEDYAGKDSNGKAKYETTWHNLSVFGKQADYLGKHAKKGSVLFVKGRTEKKKNDKGELNVNVVVNTILVISDRNKQEASNSSTSDNTSATSNKPVVQPTQQVATTVATAEDDTDLPF